MASIDVSSNRAALKYTRFELLCRVVWAVGKLLFRFSPRPCFAFRRMLLRAFGAKVGQRVNIYPSTVIYYPWNLDIGDDAAIGEWALVYNLGPVRIGSRATISQRVHLCAGTHDYHDAARPLLKPPIAVGDDVWVCADAFIGPDVSIGDGAIVGACAVVVKNVEKNTIVAGNPAKLIKMRDAAE